MTSPTQYPELRGCPNPWCVSKTLPLPVHLKRSGWRVSCGCGVNSPRFETQAEAVAAWNRRAPLPPAPGLEQQPSPEGEGVALRAERDEADRRAGAAERRLAELEDAERKANAWMIERKEEVGVPWSDPFDRAWGIVKAAWDREQVASPSLDGETREKVAAITGDLVAEVRLAFVEHDDPKDREAACKQAWGVAIDEIISLLGKGGR